MCSLPRLEKKREEKERREREREREREKRLLRAKIKDIHQGEKKTTNNKITEN